MPGSVLDREIGKKWSVLAFVGEARQSNPDNYYRIMSKQAIFVINQEATWSVIAHVAVRQSMKVRKADQLNIVSFNGSA